MSQYTTKQISELVEGKLDWDTVHRMLSMPKDADRFTKYIEVLQAKVSWKERILLALGPHLYIAQNASNKWVTKCSCGHEFGDYRENWKLNALIYVRDDEAKMNEVYPTLMAPDTKWQVYREYCCPSCGVLQDVEAPTPWYPVIHDFEPDLEAFYGEWLGLPVPEKA